jgi:hypothetical protein
MAAAFLEDAEYRASRRPRKLIVGAVLQANVSVARLVAPGSGRTL